MLLHGVVGRRFRSGRYIPIPCYVLHRSYVNNTRRKYIRITYTESRKRSNASHFLDKNVLVYRRYLTFGRRRIRQW